MTAAAPLLRPLPCDPGLPRARPLAGGPLGFREVEIADQGGGPPQVLPADAVAALHPEAAATLARLSAPRPPVAGIDLSAPRVMGVVNVTPDSFSDGGRLADAKAAVAHALALAEAGADILDIGGESTRPGAAEVPAEEEAARVVPVIEGLVAAGCPVPISVDTRKAAVASAARAAGAAMLNDVSALGFDPGMAEEAARFPAICLMHAQGMPETMQRDPRYGDVLREVYHFLSERVAAAEAAGIARARVLVDPGIGFGKTEAHNLALLRGMAAFHGIGCGVLLGVSRKRFVGRITGVEAAAARMAGSIAAGLHGLWQGVQVLRAHDVAETVQAVRMWRALAAPPGPDAAGSGARPRAAGGM